MQKPANFIATDLKITAWRDIAPYFAKLLQCEIASSGTLEDFLIHYSQVLSVYQEQNARAYIDMTCHTDREDFIKRHELFVTEIAPEVTKVCHAISEKILNNAFCASLPPRYGQLKKFLKRELELYREENVSLNAELNLLESHYEQLSGSLLATYQGKKLPLPQVSVKLESVRREERKEAWCAIQKARMAAKEKHDEIFDRMIALRHRVALNAGYKNFRDYKHAELERFDYTVDDVLMLHESIREHVLPLQQKMTLAQIERLGLKKTDFRPWDVAGKAEHECPLKPFTHSEELLAKTVDIFSVLREEFGHNLKRMRQNQLFDLEARANKAPGGYNFGLEVTGMPFIFMNAVGSHQDVITLTHEGGHAMHTFLTHDEPLVQYRHCPAETSEVASMAMELMASTSWQKFYRAEDCKRARREHLERIVSTFPWVAIVDGLQSWVYTHPNHSHEERDRECATLMDRFGTGLVNWQGYKNEYKNTWQKQHHIFSVPFYYVEYAIAQLGALQVYQNFVRDREDGLQKYINGLKLGCSRPLPEVWQTLGIQFDFSAQTIKRLMDFVEEEWLACVQ